MDDDELIDKMCATWTTRATPKPFDMRAGMLAVLALVRAHDGDAKRYRLLRNHPTNFATAKWSGILPLDRIYIVTPERLDAAIDYALGNHDAIDAARGKE